MDFVFIAIVGVALLAILIAIFAGSSSATEEPGEQIIIIEEEPLIIDGEPADVLPDYPEEPSVEPELVESPPTDNSVEIPELGPSEDGEPEDQEKENQP